MRPTCKPVKLCIIAPLLLWIVQTIGCTEPRANDSTPKPTSRPQPEQTPSESANPMSAFADLIPGEWHRSSQNTAGITETWQWGPGRLSMLLQTDGTAAAGEPWREVQVYYWHPGTKDVRFLGLSPFAKGVSEGRLTFKSPNSIKSVGATFDLFQTGGLRKMGFTWEFDSPNKYHYTLLEATSPEGLKPMNAWDLTRSERAIKPKAALIAAAPNLPLTLQPLEPLLRHAWEFKGATSKSTPKLESDQFKVTFEWVPYANAILARATTATKNSETPPTHLLDAYIYHHTGFNRLRCLALLSLKEGESIFYEGDLTVAVGGSFQFNLRGFEEDRAAARDVQIDLKADGKFNVQIWSVEKNQRAIQLVANGSAVSTESDSTKE